MATQTFEVGDRVSIGTTANGFRSKATGEVFDPENVKVEVRVNNGLTTTYVYGVDSNVTKVSTGVYSCEVDINKSGTWYYHILGVQNDGEYRGGAQGSFEVRDKGT